MRYHLIIILFFAGIIAAPFNVAAKPFDVTTTADAIDTNVFDGECITANNECSLRAAIQQANNLPGMDEVRLSAGIYSLDLAREISIEDDVKISGPADASPTANPPPNEIQLAIISGTNTNRIFNIQNGKNVTIAFVVLENGKALQGRGGAIYLRTNTRNANESRLNILDVVLRNNTAYSGGGINSDVTNSHINIERSHFIDNIVNNSGGGGIKSDGSLLVIDSLFTGNIAGTIEGGAIYANGTVTVLNSNIQNNRASAGGGGIYSSNTAVISNTTIANNIAGKIDVTTNCISNLGNGAGIGTKDQVYSYLYLFDSVIENNKACQSGGGYIRLTKFTLLPAQVSETTLLKSPVVDSI